MVRPLWRIVFAFALAFAVAGCGGDEAAGTTGGDAADDGGGRGGTERDIGGASDGGEDAADTDAGDTGADAADAADAAGDAGDTGAGDAGDECVDDGDCDDGVFCNGRERCSLGRCFGTPVDPCDDFVECTADTCDEDADECVNEADDGVCPDGQVCDPKTGCYLPAECETDDDCDDGVVCNGAEVCVEDTCAPGTPVVCDDGVSCTIDACVEPTGTCQHTPLATLCPPTDVCDPRDDCVPRPPCESDEACIDAFFCNGTEFCGDDGLCQPGPPPEIDDGIGCTLDACSEALALVTHTPIDVRCSDGQFCNGPEVCHPVDGCGAGTPPALSDGVACTTDRCDEDADFIEHLPSDALCDDGLFCNGPEACHPEDGCVEGEPPLVNDGIGCTIDTCSEIEGAVLHAPQDELCADDLVCNGAEVCDVDEGCLAGDDLALDDGIACTIDLCDEDAGGVVHIPDDSLCDNGLFCDGAETCDAVRGCIDGTPPVIDDGVGCTTDTCDEDADRVVNAPDDAVCDNGLFCDGAESCDPVRDCIDGPPPVIDDGVGCTTDACDEDADRVVNAPDDAVCDNGLFCDGAETCDPVRDCVDGLAPIRNDGIGCTIDTCNEAEDRIDHTPDDSVCDNGLFCDGAETCDAARDCIAGAPPTVDDGVGCTTDTCDEVRDRVLNTPDDGRCDNGLFCDGAETCDADLDCQSGTPPVVDDGVGCTTDTCDEGRDRVVHTPNDAVCDNGLFCDGAEVCDAARDCIAGPAPVVNDGVTCTVDACDEAADRVVHTPDDGRCDNGLFCDGTETCDAVRDCQTGPPPILTDGVGCTIDTCNEALDRIDHAPDDSRCDNGLFCDGTETCDAELDCQVGTPPTLSDGIPCTSDRCDEATDSVVHTGDDALCDNGVFCDGAEVCTVGVGCEFGTDRPDGTECGVATRRICVDGACGSSACGDGYLDVFAGEECDDGNTDPGDGCDADCLEEDDPASPCADYAGNWTVMPTVAYDCQESFFGLTVVDFSFSSLIFAGTDGPLSISGGPVAQNGTVDLEACTFTATGTISGGCNETFTLQGTFTGPDRFFGLYTVEFTGSQCGLTNCTNQAWEVTGIR